MKYLAFAPLAVFVLLTDHRRECSRTRSRRLSGRLRRSTRGRRCTPCTARSPRASVLISVNRALL